MLGISVKAYLMASSAVSRVKERANDERGQTLVEYLGVLALVAAIIVLVSTLNLTEKVRSAIEGAIDTATGRDG